MRPEILLWDLDGTLVEWKSWTLVPRVTWRHWQWLARDLGIGHLSAAWHSTLAYLAMLRNRSGLANSEAFLRDLGARLGIGCETLQRSEDRFVREGLAGFAGEIRALEPARALVEELAATGRYRMVGATNATMPQAFNRQRLAWAGYDPGLFELVTGTETAGRLKGHPGYFRDLLARLGARPEACLMIGNDGAKDLPAREVGIPVFLLDVGHLRNLSPGDREKAVGSGDCDALRRFLGEPVEV